MARKTSKRKSSLPPPTEADMRDRPERLRRTPGGGWAWRCAHCNGYASSETQKGAYVCYRHGGNRPLQRDPVKRQQYREATGKEPPRASGRPIETGWYSRSEPVKVKELVDAYRRAGEDPDDTDADMLHLRARIENMLALEPIATDVAAEMVDALEDLRAWRGEQVVDADGKTVASVLRDLERLDELLHVNEQLRKTLAKYLGFQEQIEFRHREVIKAAKARAETRFKERASREHMVFAAFLERLTIILAEQMPAAAYQALAKRLERDLDTVPDRLLQLPAGRKESS